MSSLSSSINGNENSAQLNSSNGAVEQKPVIDSVVSEEVLSTLERDVLKRTRQANMVLMRQKRLPPQEQFVIVCFTFLIDSVIKLQFHAFNWQDAYIVVIPLHQSMSTIHSCS